MIEERRFAVLIDADNISSKYIKSIFDEISNYGIVTYKRIYGDWTKSRSNHWKDILLENSVTPIQQYAYTTGKNATDSAMIIDAMDILYSGHVDGFCLVSSDSDFTRLATRLRESGMMVVGMGEEKTPRPFSAACNVFKYLNIISENDSTDSDNNESEKTPISLIEDVTIKLITEYGDDVKGMSIGELGSRLVKRHPDFDVRNYGYTKLSTFLADFSSIRLVRKGKVVTAHLKDTTSNIKKIEATLLDFLNNEANHEMPLSEVSRRLKESYPDFDVRRYGYTKFYQFVNALPPFSIKSSGKNGCIKSLVEKKATHRKNH